MYYWLKTVRDVANNCFFFAIFVSDKKLKQEKRK